MYSPEWLLITFQVIDAIHRLSLMHFHCFRLTGYDQACLRLETPFRTSLSASYRLAAGLITTDAPAKIDPQSIYKPEVEHQL